MSGSYDELREIAEAFGLRHYGDPTLELEVAGVKLEVSLDINSGTVTGLVLKLHTHPMPEIDLRRETARDVEGKQRGINREVQLGDPSFDPLVYIESDASDESVKMLFAHPLHRQAVMTLIANCGGAHFTERGVYASAGPEFFDVRRFRVLADAFAVLASLPRVPLGAVPGSGRGSAMIVLLVLSCISAIVVLIYGFAAFPPVSIALPLLGAGTGLALWFFARWYFARAIRGDSTSYRRYRIATAFALVDAVGLGCGLPVLLNGALDGEPVRHHTKILAVRSADGVTHAKLAAWAPGRPESTIAFDDPSHLLAVGDRAEIFIGRGFLGFEWKAGKGEAWSSTP